jgi:sterol desaturase/sphingolipid hydroxylase (fatty acid hydroxylase superfamily)
MLDYQIKSEGQGEIFDNDLLELLTKTNPWLTALTYGGVTAFLVFLATENLSSSGAELLLLFFTGVVFWSFLEYVLHRVVFHYTTDNKIGRWIHYALHGVHHEYPNDPSRVFMPPVPGLIISSLLFIPFYVALGDYGFIIFAGVVSGYTGYSFIHYAIHQKKAPSFLKPLWRHHLTHHFAQPDAAYGVSTRFWDRVFGTMPNNRPRKSRERK